MKFPFQLLLAEYPKWHVATLATSFVDQTIPVQNSCRRLAQAVTVVKAGVFWSISFNCHLGG